MNLFWSPLSLPSPRKAGRGWPKAGRGVGSWEARSNSLTAWMRFGLLRLDPDCVHHRHEGFGDGTGQWRADLFGQRDGLVHVRFAFRSVEQIFDLPRFVSLLRGDSGIHPAKSFGKRIRRKIVREIHAFAQLFGRIGLRLVAPGDFVILGRRV